MSTQTTNLGLTKPAGNERPLVGVLNDNMDIIDDAVGDLQESVNQPTRAVVNFQSEGATFDGNDFKTAYANFTVPEGYRFVSLLRIETASPTNLVLTGFNVLDSLNRMSANVRKVTSGSATYDFLFSGKVLVEKNE